MGTASLVLGIIALVISVGSLGGGWLLGLICSILGIIFGNMSKKNYQDEKNAQFGKTGWICSIIALVFSIIIPIMCILLLGAFSVWALML